MIAAPNLRIVPPLEPRPAALSLAERLAYQSAHEILQIVDMGERQLVCPGAIRSRRVDRIAETILRNFGGRT